MPDFSFRSDEQEIMDDLNCSGEVVAQTLKELETINKWLGGNYVTIDGLRQLIGKRKEEITIADLGCGGGDMLKLIAKWARRMNIKLKLFGVDANPNIIEFAQNNCSSYPEIEFLCLDIFSEEFQSTQFDIITSTLFTHHFDDAKLKLMYSGWLKQARLGVVINDLHRHWLAYYSIKLLTQLFSKSEMVKNDGPVSVLRSFKRKELKALFHAAEVNTYSLKWMWAFRWQIVISN
ncbi:methyltransferase domain-containing protein [Fulvivirga lutea]|nr:methyltransferase domain-containing protein [Fulvivirga lutea]